MSDHGAPAPPPVTEPGSESQHRERRSDAILPFGERLASVLFFAGVGTKFKGRGTRLFMLGLAFILFGVGVVFTFSMPQNVGI